MKYQATKHVLMRCPTRSLNEFYDFAKLSDDEIMDFCRKDKLFAEAVAIASQDLYKMYADESSKTSARMLESVKKYYDRMAARPTPYGLFAGVTTAQFSDDGTDICLSNQGKYHKICRVDNEWYFKLVKKIEETPGLLLNLQVIFNKHCYKAGSRLKNCYCSNLRKENTHYSEDLHIKHTKQVQYVQDFASDFVYFRDLRDYLISKNPTVPQEIIDKFLKELLINEYLYTNICVLSKKDDPLHSLLQNNSFSNLTSDEQVLVDKLLEIDKLRSEYEQTAFGQGEEILVRLSELMEQVVKTKNYIYTILQLSAISNCVDIKIKEELENFSDFMLAMTTPDYEDDRLKTFREKFMVKYGSDVLLPLTEVIDADKGIGLPYSDNINNAANEDFNQRYSKKLNAIKMMLENKMLEALRQGKHQVELTDRDIAQIKDIEADEMERMNYASSYSLNVLVSNSDSGYEIYIGPNVGSSQAGNGLSRFDLTLNDEFSQEMDEIYSQEKFHHSDEYIIADVYEVSHYLRNTNLYSYKRQYDYNLYLGITEFEHNTSLNLNDLYLGHDPKNNRIFIWSKSLNKRIKFLTNSMYNSMSSNPVIRFLRNISATYEIEPINTLFVFQNLKYAYWPKIKYGNIVLSNEKWRLNPTQFSFNSENQFAIELKEYAKIWQLPKYVYYTHMDNRLVLDLEDDFAFKLLYRALVKQKKEVVLERMEYENITDSLVSDEKHRFYAAEFTVPFFSTNLQNKLPKMETNNVALSYLEQNILTSFYTPNRVLYMGDEGWLYFKIYINPIQAHTLLTNYLEQFLEDLFKQQIIKKFFFIKYADPGYHIRLRLQITKPNMISIALQKFRDWFNLLQENCISHEYIIAQYEREIERYGGSSLINYAEKYFCHDSQLVISLLQESRKDSEEIEKEKIGIWVMHNLVDCFYEGLQANNDFLVKYTDNIKYKDLFRKNRKEYMAAIGDNYIENFSSKTQRIAAERTLVIRQYAKLIKQVAQEEQLANSYDNILLTLIHMFCNRYNGNREWERKVLFLTRHAVFTKNNILLHSNKQTGRDIK